MTVINTQIIRPKRGWPEIVGTAIGHVVGNLLSAFVVMLILGAIAPWHPSYGTTVLVIIAARILVPVNSTSYLAWTKATR